MLLSFSVCCSLYAFSGQLHRCVMQNETLIFFNLISTYFYRYEENPTVLSVDIVPYGEFERPSFTVCTTNYTNVNKTSVLVQR